MKDRSPASPHYLFALLLLGASTAAAAGEKNLATAFDWTLGTWAGVRIDVASGRRAPMTMRVEPILGGAGQIRHIEVEPGDDAYYGFAVQVLDAERSLWIRQYTNAGRGTFSLLEGEVKDERTSVWRGASPGRSRESRLLSERLGQDGWRRTMSISEDGGETWQDLWIDKLER